MAYRILIFPEAELDISEAALWYNERQQGLGKRFIVSVTHEIAIIKRNPLLFEIRYKDVRTAPTPRFPYLIHFTIEKQTILIKAIYHTSRSTDLWIER